MTTETTRYGGLRVTRAVDTRDFRKQDRYDRTEYEDAIIDLRYSDGRAILWYMRDRNDRDETANPRVKDMVTGYFTKLDVEGDWAHVTVFVEEGRSGKFIMEEWHQYRPVEDDNAM